MNLTSEQSAAIGSRAQSLVIEAFAGSGKTSTLVEYAKARPNKKITYLAFNRAIKEEAQKKFPSNVRCVTTHGLAYGQFGVPYQHKIGQAKEAAVSKTLKCTYLDAKAALESVGNFLCSADMSLNEKHISKQSLNPANTLDLAQILWKRMQDQKDAAIQMPHDGYLKLYQLSNPLIRSDIIMVDEFQDTNSVVIDIVTRQSSGKVFVGDSNQAIYSFRGAFNALGRVKADERLSLTTSFRFGSGIAALATLLLRDWKDEKRVIHGMGKHRTSFEVNVAKPHTIIGRTNSGLFDQAVSLADAGLPFGYVGGAQGYRLDMIMSAYNLKNRGHVADPFLASFPSFAEMENYAEVVDDKELKMLIKIVGDYGREIPFYVDKIKKKAVESLTGNEIALTTAHKSKGLEFDSVVLLDDFAELKVDAGSDGIETGPSDEEINLLYVASTRAERCLRPNPSMIEWISDIGMGKSISDGDVSSFVSQKQKNWRLSKRVDATKSSEPILNSAKQGRVGGTTPLPMGAEKTSGDAGMRHVVTKKKAVSLTGDLFEEKVDAAPCETVTASSILAKLIAMDSLSAAEKVLLESRLR